MFSGRFLPLARLVEKTFGKGSFRILGDMDDTEESARECLKILQELNL